MDKPLVTVAIPFYNNAATLCEAVQSVFAQTYTSWELLLIDDGSTDHSLSLVREIADPRVRVFHDGTNRGLIARLNQIPQWAQGQYIARMDGDDMMLPHRLEKQVAWMEAHPHYQGVDAAAYSIDQSNNPIGVRGLSPIAQDPRDILKHCRSIHGTVLAKAQWFAGHPYDPRFLRAEDYELWCRTAPDHDFGRVQEPLYLLREGKVSISNYCKSMKTLRKIFRQYGPVYMQDGAWRKEIIKTYGKEMLYRFAGILGWQDRLSARRNQSLNLPQQQDVKAAIALIQQQVVPGLKVPLP